MTTIKKENLNRDDITGEPGSHPIGTALGAGTAASAGAILGSMAGPAGSAIGAIAGAVFGGIVGGYAGKDLAEFVNPTDEETYWRETFPNRTYAKPDAKFEEYQPAYRFGYDARAKLNDKISNFDEIEKDLSTEWQKNRGESTLDWNDAKPAVRDAYDRTGQLYRDRVNQSNTSMNGASDKKAG